MSNEKIGYESSSYVWGSNAAANGWRPIETAPKDGKRVLLSWPSTLVTVGQISNLRAGAEWPTHWMPLPEPPKENSNG